MTTAGGLLFSASTEGLFFAMDAETGDMLWEAQLAPGPATPITYELDGQQYVTILSGPGGDEAAARVWTFVLDGNAPMPVN
jgi:glucose dehydrogenase